MKDILRKKILIESVNVIGVIISALIFAIVLTVFISPAGLLSGGISGITLIIGRFLHKFFADIPETTIASAFYFVLNIPLLLLGWKKLSKKFTILSALHIISTTIFLNIIPSDIGSFLNIDFHVSKLDAALFAGALAGGSTALSFLCHGSGGGIDIISAYFSTVKHQSIGFTNTIINGFILILGGILFEDWGAMLYALVYAVINAMVLDMIYVRNKRMVLNIITTNGEEVSKYIMNTFHRGVTKLDAIGEYTHTHKDFLYVVATSYEAHEMCQNIREIDPNCFISMSVTHQVFGRFVRSTKM